MDASVYTAIGQTGGFEKACHYAATEAALRGLYDEVPPTERMTTPAPSAPTMRCAEVHDTFVEMCSP